MIIVSADKTVHITDYFGKSTTNSFELNSGGVTIVRSSIEGVLQDC